MPLHVPASQSKAPEIDDGTYSVLITKVGEKTLEKDNYGNTHKALITCQFPDVIDEETGEFLELDAMCNFYISEKATLTRWLTALGVEVDLDYGADLDEAVGKEGLAVVGHKEGNAWPRVMDILPPMKKGRQPAGRGAAPVASELPSVINPDGTPNISVFWGETRKRGCTRDSVIAFAGGDVDVITSMDGPELAKFLEDLVASIG